MSVKYRLGDWVWASVKDGYLICFNENQPRLAVRIIGFREDDYYLVSPGNSSEFPHLATINERLHLELQKSNWKLLPWSGLVSYQRYYVNNLGGLVVKERCQICRCR